jgi:hypothetical protein
MSHRERAAKVWCTCDVCISNWKLRNPDKPSENAGAVVSRSTEHNHRVTQESKNNAALKAEQDRQYRNRKAAEGRARNKARMDEDKENAMVPSTLEEEEEAIPLPIGRAAAAAGQ